jgi:predicted amidohydrolase YtcJ
MSKSAIPDLILHNGRITTLDPKYPVACDLVVKDGRIIGVDEAELYKRGPDTRIIDLQGRRVIPGLNDSHLHVIRGGLNYNLELRWDGVPSLADALRMLKNPPASMNGWRYRLRVPPTPCISTAHNIDAKSCPHPSWVIRSRHDKEAAMDHERGGQRHYGLGIPKRLH